MAEECKWTLLGTPIKEDITTVLRSRPNLAKVRIEVDFQKPLPNAVWVGLEGQGTGLKGYEQKLEYEGVPAFCKTSRLQVHDYTKYKVEAKKKKKKEEEEHEENEEAEINQSSEEILHCQVQDRRQQPLNKGKKKLQANINTSSTSKTLVNTQDANGFTQVTRKKEEDLD
ncbi:hypothetical protein HAX54_050829 [Datura stramonium]|uniref:Uncharacterized protein n=1 Tax=Datura stramonium TaxID=4076 RepID=A0ABS8SXS3_DATST|nr:hypothetical protein [Datura stramonium]